MNTLITMKRTAEASPRFRLAITAVFYLFTMLMAVLVLSVHGRLALLIDLIASLCYVAVTALFYDVSKPVNRSVSFVHGAFQSRALNSGSNNLARRGDN